MSIIYPVLPPVHSSSPNLRSERSSTGKNILIPSTMNKWKSDDYSLCQIFMALVQRIFKNIFEEQKDLIFYSMRRGTEVELFFRGTR